MKLSFKFLVAVLCLLLSFSLFACAPTQTDDSGSSQTSSSTSNTKQDDDTPPKITVDFNNDYSLTKFDKSSVTYTATQVVDGLIMVETLIAKNNGDIVKFYTLEVDLEKVNIKAGTKNNTTSYDQLAKEVPARQASAYEKATGKQVYAYLNADFFGSKPVNAFVKDGIIVKDSHNDNLNYDYKDLSADVPASAPMLFGVKDTTAQVAPIIKYTGDIQSAEVKKQVITAKLTYKIGADNSSKTHEVLENQNSSATKVVFNYAKTPFTCKAGDYALKVTIANGYNHMRVMQKITCTADTTFTPDDSFAYIFVGKDSTATTEFSTLERKYVSFFVTSPDNTWKGYDTILGCRQSLVENGAVSPTVTKENSNGAQSTDIPRSAVGVKGDGTVVIFAVESMYYGKKAQDGDTHGVSLPEIADFMVYYNIKNGANFDGGGSTQLTVNLNGTKTVMVRSSDTGLTDLTATRSVINTVLVTEK